MTANADEACSFRFSYEIFFQFFISQVKGDVHFTTIFFISVTNEETVTVINYIVNYLCFFRVVFSNYIYATLTFNPVQGFVYHIDAEHRRSVIQGIVFSESGIFQHGGQIFVGSFQERFFSNYDNHACRAKIFLCTCVNQIEICYVYSTRENITTHIADYRYIKFREVRIFSTVDCIIGSNVYIGSFRFNFKLLGNVAVISICTACSFVSFAIAFSFSQSFFRPNTGVDVSSSCFSKEVCCGHQELSTATTLNEKDFVVFRNFHQFTKQVLSFFMHCIVFGTAMAHFDNAHASSSIVQKFSLCFLQNFQRHCRRASVKIICTFHKLHLLL